MHKLYGFVDNQSTNGAKIGFVRKTKNILILNARKN